MDRGEDHVIHCFEASHTCRNGAVMLIDQFMVRHDLGLNRNPFTESGIKDAKDFLKVDESAYGGNDEIEIDICIVS